MSHYKEILYQKQRGGVLITMNRPEALNAITRPMLKEIHHALDEAEADPETLRRFIAELKTGLPFARVDAMTETDIPARGEEKPFDIH